MTDVGRDLLARNVVHLKLCEQLGRTGRDSDRAVRQAEADFAVGDRMLETGGATLQTTTCICTPPFGAGWDHDIYVWPGRWPHQARCHHPRLQVTAADGHVAYVEELAIAELGRTLRPPRRASPRRTDGEQMTFGGAA